MSGAQPSRPCSVSPAGFDPYRLWLSLCAAVALLRAWRRRARERAELGRLSDRELRDFGVSRGEAIAEAAKPVWRA